MKLSKTTGLVIAIGVFVIALISLGVVRYQQIGEQSELDEQLISAKSNLARVQPEKLSSRHAELEEQLSQSTSQFEAVKVILSQPVGSVAATTVLFDVAKSCGLEVTKVASLSPTSDSLEGVTCSVVLLTARVEGDVPNLVSFITTLNSHFTTGVIRSMTISIPEENSGEEASADIELVVYTYQGD